MQISEGSAPRPAPWLLLLAMVLAPLALLGPCILGTRTFVPFDLAQYAPVKTKLTPEQLHAVTLHQNTDVTEVPITFVPELRLARQELAAGRLPEWNPWARGGAPLLATAVVGLLYPPSWLLLLFEDPQEGLAFGAWLSLAAAGALMLGLLRQLGLSSPACAFGALAFVLSGTLYANAHFYQRLAALVWLPGMLWALQAIFARTGKACLRPTAGLAVCVALTWLAGFPSYAAPATLVAALWALALATQRARAQGVSATASPLLATALGAGLGLGLAAVQLVPMFAFFPESNRTVAPTPSELASQGFDPAGWLGYLLPDPFGHPWLTTQLPYDSSPLALATFTRGSWLAEEAGQLFFPLSYNFVEYTVFPGTLVLLLALAGLSWRGKPWRLWALGALVVLLTLGLGSVALASVHQLPALRNVPPKRFLGPACALVALLAALGFDSAWRGHGRWRWPALGVLSALLATGCWLGAHALRGLELPQLHERFVAHALQRFAAGRPDLTRSAVDYAIMVSGERPYGTLPVARQQLLDNLGYGGLAFGLGAVLLGALELARGRPRLRGALLLAGALATLAQLLTLARGVSPGRELHHAIDSDVHRFLRAERARLADQGGFTLARGDSAPQLPITLPPCSLVPEHIRDLNIYTFVDGRSHRPLARAFGPGQMFRDYWVNALPDSRKLGHPLLDLYGVRYLVSDKPLTHAGTPVGPEWRGPGGEVFVYERPNALPRAFTVPAARVLADDDAVVEALAADDLDPRAAVLLTADEARRAAPVPRAATWAPRDVRFTRDASSELSLEVEAGEPCYLVLADTAMSGWTATVNGAPAAILRGNLWMRAVLLPAGPAEVRFRYRTPGLAAGAAASAGALVVLLGLWLLARRRGGGEA